MLKAGLCLLLCLIAGTAWGDWSPDIIIYEGDGTVHPGGMGSVIAVDPQENVHIVHTFQYRHPDFPQQAPLDALRYVKLDSHGQILITRVISDSIDIEEGNQKIHVFDDDSLWVAYGFSRDYVEPFDYGYALRCLDINGNQLGERRVLQQNDRFGLGYVFDVRSDGAWVLAYPDEGDWQTPTRLKVTVQLPNGERTLDTVKVWQAEVGLDRPRGYIDDMDSLQIAWREVYWSGLWSAIFAKRVATNVPFDTATVMEHVELSPPTPGNHHVPLDLRRLDSARVILHDDSLSGFTEISILRILNRSDYSEASRLVNGHFSPRFALEGDTVINVLYYSDGSYYLGRYSLLDFQLLTNELIATGMGIGPYTVSPAGERHLLLTEGLGNDNARLIYRYWRSDLSVPTPRSVIPPPDFTIIPNPTHGEVTLNGPMGQIKEIRVYDLLGRQVESLRTQSHRSEGSNVTLSLNMLPAGVYFLRIEAGPHIILKKFVLLK